MHSDDGLTWSSLHDMFCRKSQCGEQLHHYLQYYLSHGRCRRDLGVDVEAFQKVFYGLEHIHKSIKV